MFTTSYRRLFVLLSLFAIAVAAGAYVRLHRPFAATRGGGIAGALSVEKSGSGLAVSWNPAAPIFHNARNVTLEIEDGEQQRTFPLDLGERTSSLFYSPHEADVTLRLRIQPEAAGEPEKIEVIRLVSQNVDTVAEAPKRRDAAPPVPEEGSRSRLESPVSVWRVRAFAPPSLTSQLADDGMEVAVYVKIEPSGKVSEATTRPYGDALGTALAKIATEAAQQWKFQPLKGEKGNPIYRDFVIHFKFPKT